MKYNFKRGDQVEIYRTPIDGLGVEVAQLPPVGSKGVVDSWVLNYVTCENAYPYVYINFKGDDNHIINSAIPCSCLKRVKPYKIIKVPAKVKDGLALCMSQDGTFCNYYKQLHCTMVSKFPTCSEESIIYLKVINET